jgi:hypothetical protein
MDKPFNPNHSLSEGNLGDIAAGQAFARQNPTTTFVIPSSSLPDDPMKIGVTHVLNPPNSRTSGKKDPLNDAKRLPCKENHLCLYCVDSV